MIRKIQRKIQRGLPIELYFGALDLSPYLVNANGGDSAFGRIDRIDLVLRKSAAQDEEFIAMLKGLRSQAFPLYFRKRKKLVLTIGESLLYIKGERDVRIVRKESFAAALENMHDRGNRWAEALAQPMWHATEAIRDFGERIAQLPAPDIRWEYQRPVRNEPLHIDNRAIGIDFGAGGDFTAFQVRTIEEVQARFVDLEEETPPDEEGD